MRFAFTDEQVAFREAVSDLLTAQCPPEVVRAAWPDPTGAGAGSRAPEGSAAVDRVWASLAEMGVLGVAAPEALGGLGLAEPDWVLLAEEAGYAALPAPFVETVGVAVPLLGACGDDGGRLAPILAGTSLVTTRLVGNGPFPYAGLADIVLLSAGGEGAVSLSAGGEGAVSLSALDGAALGKQGAPSVDGSRDLGVLADPSGAEVLTTDRAEIDLATARGVLGTAAQLLGLSRRMLELTVGYVTERRQFGVPVGSFQAVKHHLVDARLGLEFAAPAVSRAAWSLATGAPTAQRDVSMAKALASDAADLTGRQALQCHGAIGYTVEYDLHLYLKRAWALSRSWGDAAWHRDRVATALGI